MTSAEPSPWSPVTLTIWAVVVVVACLLLGRWQLGRVNRPVDGYSAEPAAVPLDRLAPKGASVTGAVVARQVTVTGHYDVAAQTDVSGHSLGGQQVYWVVTPLVLADASQVPIVRGWVNAPGQSLAVPPGGEVSVTARLESGSIGPASVADHLASGYLVRTAQSPPDPLSLQPVPVPAPRNSAPDEFHLQNAIYVVQWWLLALIMAAFWWRLIHASRVGGRDREVVGVHG